MNPRTRRPGRPAPGFTLIEALIALLVVSFGVLALTTMQVGLSRNADVAKQRTEALRLAQDKMEELRSFTGISTGTLNWNGLASSASNETIGSYTLGNSTVNTNTTYTRSWTLGGASGDRFRALSVTVTWPDRAGTTQSVSLSSVISRTDPSDGAFLAYPLPQNTNLKRPKNRNINIPVQATDLGGGKASIQFTSTYAIVFSNTSGFVVEKCNTTVTAANYQSLVDSGACQTYNAYILAGYVSGSSGSVTSDTSGAGTRPTGISLAGVTGWDSSGGKTISCTYGQAEIQNDNSALGTVTVTNANPAVFTRNGHGLANGTRVRLTTAGSLPSPFTVSVDYFVVGSTSNTFQLSATSGGFGISTAGSSQSGTHSVARSPSLIAGFHYYLCVIPVAAGGSWSGTVRLAGLPTGAGNNYKVCRFQYAASPFVTDNQRNVQPYSGVAESLDNQNYYLESSNNNNCPTLSSTGEPVSNASVATVLHQNCRSGQANVTNCPATGTPP